MSLEEYLPYKSIEEIPYEVVTDELKEELVHDYKLLTTQNIDELEEGTIVRYVRDTTNTKAKRAKFIKFTDEDKDMMNLTWGGRNIYVGLENHTVFFRYRKTDGLRRTLEGFLKNNFKIVKIEEQHNPDIHFIYTQK